MSSHEPDATPMPGPARDGRAAVVVPLPAADWLVADAHVPLLAPLPDLAAVTPGVVDELRLLFGDVVPFGVELSGVSRFPGGLVYLPPRPSAPFHQLSLTLIRRFPELRPPGLGFDDVVPHVPVADADDATVARLERQLDEHPVTVRASTAVLRVRREDGRVELLAEFAFGTSAA